MCGFFLADTQLSANIFLRTVSHPEKVSCSHSAFVQKSTGFKGFYANAQHALKNLNNH
jgi:hypothetical protein